MSAPGRAGRPPAQYVAHIAHALDHARRILKSGDELMPAAFVINTARRTCLIVGGAFKSNDDKDYFAESVRQAASKHAADAVLMLSEVWSLHAKDRDRYDAIRDQYGSLEHYPGRRDQLMVKLESRAGNWLGLADLLPAKKGRKPGGVQWFSSNDPDDRHSGRFSHLLPVIYATPDQVAAFLADARAKLAAAGIDGDAQLHRHSLLEILEAHVRQAPADKLTPDVVDSLIALHRLVDGDGPG